MATSFHFPSDHQTIPTVKMNNQSATVVNNGSSSTVAFGNQLISSQNMSLYGFPTSSKPITEKSKELSSMPNFMSNSNKSCFSDRCLSCNKKKRMINGEDTIIHMENMIRENNHFGIKPSRIEKGVDIVAIHRKGGSSDEGAVVMEYEFFPEKNGSKNTNTSCFGKIISNNSSPQSSSVAAAVGNINGEASCVTTISWVDTITTPTSSIDLSLKLSC
ncbi:hypothetical protein RND71_037841 [Anisodus tanguticus]|uniref:Uncharacterized protein n=1 Tax=Anisodus tanguticus TaxID=243964 RepID=A0AAE1UYY5_9SOLA|nr:hypothetical protein RND71_037841 [Anisodus tanguticus]